MKKQTTVKLILGGTPSVAGLSKIEQSVNEFDIMVLLISCHNCEKNMFLIGIMCSITILTAKLKHIPFIVWLIQPRLIICALPAQTCGLIGSVETIYLILYGLL